MITIKRNGNFRLVGEKLKKLEQEFKTGNFLERTAQLLNSSIQLRVQRKGEGLDGKVLSPYKPAYADWKSNKGRQVGYRDLTFSGKMWQSLSTSKISGGAKMFFNGAENVNKMKGNEARTPFFGIGSKEKEIIKRELTKLFNVN